MKASSSLGCSSRRVHSFAPASLTRHRLTAPPLASYKKSSGSTIIDEEKARKAATAAGKQLREWGEQAGDAARRTWRKLDSEYSLEDKFERSKRRLLEQARDVDQTYNVRRRIRSTVDDVRRKWPAWQAQLDEFAQTWYGKVVILGALFLLISSPIFWSVLNFVLLLWWLAIPIGAALLQSAAQRAAEQAAAQAEAERRRQANPFADMFKQAQARSAAGSSGGFNSGSGARKSGYRPPEGPIIDADYVVISEDKGKK